MNTRRGRGRQKPTDSPEVSSTTPLKKTLLTPCRRMGLGRKRNVNSPDIGKTTRLDCTPSLDDSENLVSETPSKETSATLDAGPSSSLPATPIEPVAKSSSSRRKKSSNPLKRTVDESPNVSEGNKTIVLLSPVHKKRKLELVDIFNSETTHNPPQSDSPNPKSVVITNSPSKSDNKSTNFSVKVSLPLELSQKYITSPPKPKTSDKKALIETLSHETNLVETDVSDSVSLTKNAKPLPKNPKRNKSKDKLIESDANLIPNDDFQMTDKSLVMDSKTSKRRKNNNKTSPNDSIEGDSIKSDSVSSLVVKKTVIGNKNKRRQNKNKIQNVEISNKNCLLLDAIPTNTESKVEENIISDTKSEIDDVISLNHEMNPKSVENDLLTNDSSSDIPILTKFKQKQKKISKTKNTKRKKMPEKLIILTNDDLKPTDENSDDENVFRDTKFIKRKNKLIVDNSNDDFNKNSQVKINRKNNKTNLKSEVQKTEIVEDLNIKTRKKTNARNKNSAKLIDNVTNLEDLSKKSLEKSKPVQKNSRKKKVVEKVVSEDPKDIVIEENPIDSKLEVKKIQNLDSNVSKTDEKIPKVEQKVENKCLDDTMPIKKRKMRGKVENLSEDVENFIPCTLIDKSIAETAQNVEHDSQSSVINEGIETENSTQKLVETPNIIAQIVNDFEDDFDDDLDDFRPATPRTKSKLTIINKAIEKTILRKKIGVKSRNKNETLVTNKFLSFNDADLNPESDILKIRQSISLPMSSDSEDSIPLSLRKEETKIKSSDIEERRMVSNCDESSLDSSQIEEMIIKQMDETRKENLANSQDKSLKHEEETHVGTFEKIISSTINDRILKSKEDTARIVPQSSRNEEISLKIDSIYDFQSDSNEKVSLLDLRSKRKREGRISITEESEYSSSNYTTPSFSPIDEIVKQCYEKELQIAKNEVFEKLYEFGCERRNDNKTDEDNTKKKKVGEEYEEIVEENQEKRQEIIFQTNKNIVDDEILNIIEDTRLPSIQIDSTICKNDSIFFRTQMAQNSLQVNITPKPVSRFEYKSFDEDFEGFNNELLHQKQRLEREKLAEKNTQKISNDSENNLSLLELKRRAEGEIGEKTNLKKVPEKISEEIIYEKISTNDRIQDLLGLGKKKDDSKVGKCSKMPGKDFPTVKESENVVSESRKVMKMGSDDGLDILSPSDVQTKSEKLKPIEKIVGENVSEDKKSEENVENVVTVDSLASQSLISRKTKPENLEIIENIVGEKISKNKKNVSESNITENVTSDNSLESLPHLDRKMKVRSSENFETFEKIVNQNVTENKKSEINISEPKITENISSDDSLESVPLLKRKMKVKNIDNFETFEKIVNENVSEVRKSEKNISEPKITKNVTSDDRLESRPLQDCKTKAKNVDNFETFEKFVTKNVTEVKKSEKNISEPKITQNASSDDSLESRLSQNSKMKVKNVENFETFEKIVNENVTEVKKSEKNISEPKITRNITIDDSSESRQQQDHQMEVKNVDDFESFEKIVNENVTDVKKSKKIISDSKFTKSVTSDDSLDSRQQDNCKTKAKNVENFESFEKIVNENVIEVKKPNKNSSEAQIILNISSDDSSEPLYLPDRKINPKNEESFATENYSKNNKSGQTCDVQTVSDDSLESLPILDRVTKLNDFGKIVGEIKKSEKEVRLIEKGSFEARLEQFGGSLIQRNLEISLSVDNISENKLLGRNPQNLAQRLRSGAKMDKLISKTVDTPEKITFMKAPRSSRLSLRLKQDPKLEVMDSLELKMSAKYEISAPLRVARVILIPIEYEKRYRKYLTPPLKNDEKIYRIPKTADERSNRRKKIVKKIDDIEVNKIMLNDFEQPSPSRRSFGLKISKIESNYDENVFQNVKTPKKIELSNKAPKENNSREESVFFTPPSSRSENDSDSNRNDFQTESEISPTSSNSNPFGEGTSKRITLKELSVSNLTEIIGIPPSKTPRILSPEIIENMFKKHERSEDDKEVEELTPRSPKRIPSRGKKRKNSSRSSLSKHNLTNDQTDSDDDFVSPNGSKTLIKDETGTKSKLKSLLKKKTDLLNNAENFRITKSSTITALHRGHVVAYVKSHDYDISLKTTESDDNLKVAREVPRETMIVERFSYSGCDRVPSMFDSVVDDPEGYLASQEIVETPKKKTTITRTDIKDEIIQTERRIKEKEAKLERLKLIGVYKKTHDLEKLKKLTAQLKRGCQDALLELAAVLRETSYTPFDMATLLHNMHIPNDQVGYNPEVDEFL